MGQDYLLIGMDGGATKISGWEIRRTDSGNLFRLGTFHSEKSYSEIPGFIPDFKPILITKQLEERDQGAIKPTDDERQQEAVYVEACAAVIEEIAHKSNCDSVLAGIGMPGLKTENRRGIAVVANGPRMIQYSDLLEERLRAAHITLKKPVQHLGSDADYCGIGENYAQDGLFRDIENGYYLGGGTGVADAMKLNDRLLPFDQAKEWIAKSWEMKNDDGISLERFASAGGIQSIYSEISGIPVSLLNQEGIYPLQMADRAAAGEMSAIQTFERVAENLALLFLERVTTLYTGWQNIFSFVNAGKPALSPKHPYNGSRFERILVGQRLGELFDSENGCTFLKNPALDRFRAMLEEQRDLPQEIKDHYSDTGTVFRTSQLREAPAIGAGIDAFLSLKTEP